MSTFDISTLIEVTFDKPDDFLKIKETLTRIGVYSAKNNSLYQSCHILHKQGRYFIVHFKELFALDGKPTDIDENDLARRNTISQLLESWDLLKIKNPAITKTAGFAEIRDIRIVSYKDKSTVNLVSKYNIGKKR